MTKVTFQILDGVDKGRVFRDLTTPLTIGREEGNGLRLNDERVSRFHAKVQIDSDDIILTDLESTNGTRVNGTVVQIRRLRFGDRIGLGRSLLLFGSNEEIAARLSSLASQSASLAENSGEAYHAEGPATIQAGTLPGDVSEDADFSLNTDNEPVSITRDAIYIGNQALPPLPQKMTPSQAARFAEIIDFLHRGLTRGTEPVQAKDDGTQVTLNFADWQRVLAIQMLLARYLRAISEPDTLHDE